MAGSFNVWLRNDQLDMPNGLLVEGNQLIVGSWGVMKEGVVTETQSPLKTVDIDSKKISSLGVQHPGGFIDGVEPDGNGNYFVTDWMNGKLLHIQANGTSTTLLHLNQGSADHTVLLDQGLIIIPMMLDGYIAAYRIKQ